MYTNTYLLKILLPPKVILPQDNLFLLIYLEQMIIVIVNKGRDHLQLARLAYMPSRDWSISRFENVVLKLRLCQQLWPFWGHGINWKCFTLHKVIIQLSLFKRDEKHSLPFFASIHSTNMQTACNERKIVPCKVRPSLITSMKWYC